MLMFFAIAIQKQPLLPTQLLTCSRKYDTTKGLKI